MNLTGLIRKARLKLNDPSKLYWSDVEIARQLVQVQRALARRKIAARPSWGETAIDLVMQDHAEVAEQLDTSTWLYTLPTWVYRVLSVHRLSGGFTIGEIEKQQGGTRNGWRPYGANAIAIQGNASSQDLRVVVSRLPGQLVRGVVEVASPDLSIVVIPTQLAIESGATERFDVDLEENCWVGSRIEVQTADSSHNPRGVIGVVKAQRTEYSSTLSSYQTYLTLRPRLRDFVKVGDLFETHAEIGDGHLELLALLAAEALFSTQHNVGAIATLQPQIAREWNDFQSSLQALDGDSFHVIEIPEDDFQRRDPERDLTTFF